MKKATKTKYVAGKPLSVEQLERLQKLAKKPDTEIDFSDIPETSSSDWKNAVRGHFFRPTKKALSLRLDSDVLAWLKKDGDGYQTRANRMLRERMLQDLQAERKNAA